MLQANADVTGRFNVTWDVSQLVTHHSYSQLLLDNTINSTDTDAVGKEGTAARRGSASPRRSGGDDRVASGKRGDGKVSEALRKELQEVLAEHAEINKLSDDLRDRGREAGSLVHFQLRSNPTDPDSHRSWALRLEAWALGLGACGLGLEPWALDMGPQDGELTDDAGR